MSPEFLLQLPKEIGSPPIALSFLGALIGVGLWLIGARYSRTLITLVLVSTGGWIGLLLPAWLGWNIDGWATSILTAIALGLGGFLLHRIWVGMGLGLAMTGWAIAIVWICCRGDSTWSLPNYVAGLTASEYVKTAWLGLPDAVRHVLPVAAAAAMIGGFLAALLWPRLGVVMLYSLLGVSLMVTMGIASVRFARPQWIDRLPATPSSRALAVTGLIGLGALLQWHLALSRRGPKSVPARPVVVVQ